MHGNNISIVKKANRYLIITAIRRYKRVTIESLMDTTGLSRPTVKSILNELMENNLVETTGLMKTEIGRQPTIYQLNMKLNYAVGIDIEIPPIHLLFTDLDGNIVFHDSWDEQAAGNEERFFGRIIESIHKGIRELSITSKNIIGIGMGIPGLIDIHQNIIIHIPRFTDIDVTQFVIKIESELGINVFLCNDVKLMAMSDTRIMNSKFEHILYIAYRTGIGMAILHKNKIYDGEYGNSGYLGHTTIDPHGKPCSCGNNGCLELYCSRLVLLENYNASAPKTKADTFDFLLKLADTGNPEARRFLDEGAKYFGIAIANAMKLFDISVVIISELCSNKDDYYFKSIQNSVKNCMTHTKSELIFLLGDNEQGSFAIGGCKFIWEKFFKEPELHLPK